MRTLLTEKAKQELQIEKNQVFVVKKELFELFKDGEKRAEYYRDLIEDHVALRVALFFQQAVVCYQTGFHYEISDTEGQIFSAKTLYLKRAKKKEILAVNYQAAHSSTIPSLQACRLTDYRNAKKTGASPTYFAFLQDSQLEMLNNSTVALPRFVNQLDTLIDGTKANEKTLRNKTVKLINLLAKGRLNPCEATQIFLQDFLGQLETAPRRISKPKKTPASMEDYRGKIKTVEIYKQKVKELIDLSQNRASLSQESNFFDSLLSTNFSRVNQLELPLVRKIFYQRKFEIIREAQCTDAKIQAIIMNYFAEVVKPAEKHQIRQSLLLLTKNDLPLNRSLQILFAMSTDALCQDKKLVTQLKANHLQWKEGRWEVQARYQKALRAIRATIRRYHKLENSFQAMLLRDFRVGLRGFTQKQLSQKIQKLVHEKILKEEAKPNPNYYKINLLRRLPTSAATISRLENERIYLDKSKEFKTPKNQRRKIFNLTLLKIIAKVLKVDYNYFICSFFASSPLAAQANR